MTIPTIQRLCIPCQAYSHVPFVHNDAILMLFTMCSYIGTRNACHHNISCLFLLLRLSISLIIIYYILASITFILKLHYAGIEPDQPLEE